MMRYAIAAALLLLIAGTAGATMWLYDDPTFFHVGNQYVAPSFQPMGLTPLEIVQAPFFPLLGQTFYKNALPVQMRNTSQALQIGSSGVFSSKPVPVTFSGNLENNLRYATAKSSLRIGQAGSWENLNPPGLIM